MGEVRMSMREEKRKEVSHHNAERDNEFGDETPTVIIRKAPTKEQKPLDDLDSWCWKIDHLL